MIECTRFKSCRRDSFVGFADFFIDKWGVELQGCSLYMKNGQKWLNLPAKEYQNEQGERKFAPYVRFREKDHYKRFCEAAIRAIDEYCAKEGVMMNEGEGFSYDDAPF